MKRESRDPKRLVPYERNARVHSAAQIDEIAKSIRTFGFLRPVVVDENDMILAGHGAVMAAVREGLDSIPVQVVKHLSEREKRAYVLADNKLAHKSSWDFEMLTEELSELSELNFDLSITGFTDAELDALLKDDASILPPGFDEPTSSPRPSTAGDGEGREIPEQEDGELIPLGSGVSRSPIEIPKVLFGKYSIPLTKEESERLEREIKTYVDEHGTLAGFVTRHWNTGDPD